MEWNLRSAWRNRWSASAEWAAALLDRLLHRCHMVNIRGNSYRMRRHVQLSKAIHPTASRAVSAEHAENAGPGS